MSGSSRGGNLEKSPLAVAEPLFCAERCRWASDGWAWQSKRLAVIGRLEAAMTWGGHLGL